jgi:hypothetical protein
MLVLGRIASILALITIIIGVLAPIPSFSQSTVTKPYAQNYYAKYNYLVHIELSTGSSETITVSFTILVNLTDSSVFLRIILDKIVSEATVSTSPYTKSSTITLPPSQRIINYTLDYSDLYSGILSDLAESLSGLGVYSPTAALGMLDYTVSIEKTVYSGTPSLHLKMRYKGTVTGGNVKIDSEAYLQYSLLLPIHTDLVMDFNTTNGTRIVFGTVHGVLEMLGSNLPKNTPIASRDVGSARICTGGLRGADIVIYGRKGDDKLNVTNKGTSPGYVIIFYKASSAAQIGLEGNGNLKIIDVPAGTTKRVNLGFKLPENINVESKATASAFPLSLTELAVLVLVVGLIAALVYIILKASRRTTRARITGGNNGSIKEPAKANMS